MEIQCFLVRVPHVPRLHKIFSIFPAWARLPVLIVRSSLALGSECTPITVQLFVYPLCRPWFLIGPGGGVLFDVLSEFQYGTMMDDTCATSVKLRVLFHIVSKLPLTP